MHKKENACVTTRFQNPEAGSDMSFRNQGQGMDLETLTPGPAHIAVLVF
jgi:hypothetical protein